MNFRFRIYHLKYFFFLFLFFLFPSFSFALSVGQEAKFNIDSSYDLNLRDRISAILIKITNQLYFFADKDWWQSLDTQTKNDLEISIYNLSVEFERNIYPKLTQTFGSEPKPGIDKDERIFVLIHPMNPDVGGYSNSCDLFPKIQCPRSNEREIIYLNSRHIGKPMAKVFLAHEFMHLIQLNQKDVLRNISEETWLSEARAEYVSTFLGYDDVYQGSNLERRVKNFLSSPQDSLTDWQNKISDYGVINLFTQYLVDNYGIKVLIDSLQSNKVGIESINYALKKNNYDTDFSQIFKDWLIATLVNDCSLGEKYCYKNPALKSLKIVPEINFSPMGGESILTLFRTIKDFAGDWQKFVGGYGNLTLEFDGQNNAIFDVSYLICDKSNLCQIKFLPLDANQDGKISISDFDKNYSSLTLITFSKTKTSGFEGQNPFYSYSIKITFSKKTEIPTSSVPTTTISCRQILNNLRYGMRSSEVRCLQEFLKSQGPEIYPEGLVTGYFGPLTLAAVKRFQQKYWQEILAPWGLTKDQPTGFVGPTTRSKINQLLQSQF
jgi:hypothetical protein